MNPEICVQGWVRFDHQIGTDEGWCPELNLQFTRNWESWPDDDSWDWGGLQDRETAVKNRSQSLPLAFTALDAKSRVKVTSIRWASQVRYYDYVAGKFRETFPRRLDLVEATFPFVWKGASTLPNHFALQRHVWLGFPCFATLLCSVYLSQTYTYSRRRSATIT